MISLITFVELRSMEGRKRPRNSGGGVGGGGDGAINFVDEEERARSSSSNNTALVGIRSEILKEEGGVPGDYCYADVAEGDGIHQEQQQHHQEQQQHQQHQQEQDQHQQEHDSSKGFAGYGHLLGPDPAMSNEYRRMVQWNSAAAESFSSDFPERYKRVDDPAEAGHDDRRVRSRSGEPSVLSNLLGRRDDQTELHMNISARTLRPSGGKDRHSKVFTAKGPRDRRVRLSVSTAIQFYDVQDRLGYDQPSKAVEWLMKKAKNAIDELSQIPLPGIDRLFPTATYSTSQAYGYSSTTSGSGALSGSSIGHEGGGGQFSGGTSFASASDMHLKAVLQSPGVLGDQELDNPKVCSSSRQAVDESDNFARQRREDLGADITMSVGEDGGSSRTGRAAHHHHHPGSIAGFSAGQISTEAAASCQLQQQQQQQRDWKSLVHQNSSSSSSFTLYDANLVHTDQQHHHHHHHHHQQQQHHHHGLELFHNPAAVQYHQQQQQQLIAVQQHQQAFLQQQDFLHNTSVVPLVSAAATATPPGSSIAKPALDRFRSLKIASPAALVTATAAEEKLDSVTSSTSLRFPSSFLGSPFTSSANAADFSPKIGQPQQIPPPSMQFDSSQEFPAKFQSLEEHLRRGSKRRDQS